MIQRVIRKIYHHLYKPLLIHHLQKERSYSLKGIDVKVPVGVFHPGFFYSTKLLFNYLEQLNLTNNKVLEIGCGSGILSILCSKKGANVTALDISLTCVRTTLENAKMNNVLINVIHSDLFNSIKHEKFDLIVVNPPYFKKDPQNLPEHAWFCGRNGEYFLRFFKNVGAYLNSEGMILMVLSEHCDLEIIQKLLKTEEFKLSELSKRKNLLETNTIFSINRARAIINK